MFGNYRLVSVYWRMAAPGVVASAHLRVIDGGSSGMLRVALMNVHGVYGLRRALCAVHRYAKHRVLVEGSTFQPESVDCLRFLFRFDWPCQPTPSFKSQGSNRTVASIRGETIGRHRATE